MRRLLPAFLFVLLLTGCGTIRHQLRHITGSPEARLADDVVIERDEWGVPHVHGRSDAAAAFGLAYAMAEDGYRDIEQAALEGLGWLAHYHGEAYLAQDLARAAIGAERLARAAFAAEPLELQQVWGAFAQGLNYYLQRHPEAPRRLIAHWEPWMLFARSQGADEFDDAALARLAEHFGVASPPREPRHPDHSFAWPVAAPAAGGAAFLVAGLDAPYFGAGRLYEAEVRSDHGWHAAGAAVLGEPVFRAGQGSAVAWALLPAATPAHRVVIFDHPTDSLSYREADGWRVAVVRAESVAVNTAAGVVRRSFRFLDTAHGTVVARRGDTAWVATPAAPVGWHGMHRLSRGSLTDLREQAPQDALPGRALVLADTSGAADTILLDGTERTPGVGERPPSDSAASAAALEQAVFDTRAASAASDIARLVDQWEMIGGTNPRRAFAADSAIEALRHWDGRFDVASHAAVLYADWHGEYVKAAYQEGVYGHFRALEEVVARRRARPAPSVTWGDVQRLQRAGAAGGADADSVAGLALAAAPAFTDAVFTVTSVPAGAGRRYAVAGRAWTAVIELSPPPRSRTVTPFGPHADRPSAPFRDAAEWFAAGRLKDLGFGPPASAQARERYHPGERARVLRQ